MDLAARLDRLERSNRRWRALALAGGLGCALALLGGAGKGGEDLDVVADEVRANRVAIGGTAAAPALTLDETGLTLCDEKGQVRSFLKVRPDGTAVLHLAPPKGKHRMGLLLEAGAEGGRVVIRGQGGEVLELDPLRPR